ncbi:hypothetical protein K488DRAFT_78882 [Vararia minispora EC-137]|uniref:Uncharacterized protein n=1 Tax=Vararia minispora EC-137 TaxID=1314806 RepID=A0ACB8QJ53_9AGAM|nr:hypothetical protein K488DRAFT_78882 [Vararia minispora EC-137]
MSSRKRKFRGQHAQHRSRWDIHEHDYDDDGDGWEEQHWQRPPAVDEPPMNVALHVVAHEADVVRGSQAIQSAVSLEVSKDGIGGKGLMKLTWTGSDGKDVWVDRYDARLLLDGPLTPPTAPPLPPEPPSPNGWSDLPSDAEDTFFLAPEDIDDYERTKRRRAIEQLREERLRAMEGDDDGVLVEEGEQWGGSDEEPDEEQKAVMRRTAIHLLSSPNIAQLEMRILANHGAHPRFAFLRGRWPRAWAAIRAQVRGEKEGTRKGQSQEGTGLEGLMAYADSSESGNDDGDGDKKQRSIEASAFSETARVEVRKGEDANGGDEEAVKEARRVRARKWAEKRRAASDPVVGKDNA